MASHRNYVTYVSMVVVIFLMMISWYTFSSYHEDDVDVPLYKSGFSRAYAWYMKTVEAFTFQDADGDEELVIIDNLADHLYSSTKTFDVDSYGAKGDGKKDDTKAFKKAWKAACASTTTSIFSVPKNKTYLVTPIKFEGPCKASITMQISGTIIASTNKSKYKKDEKHWLRVDKVSNLVIEGGGVIDGNGDIWWSTSCKVDKTLPCKDAPTALTLYKCTTLSVNNLNIQNAQQIQISFDHCDDVQVSNIQVTAPEDSPNTDGIHVTHTQNIKISDSVIGTGDDCISIVSGSSNVQASGITCGPGHGISIGSLGSKNTEAHVSDVTIDGATLTGTTNGVRIKTWQGGSGNATKITFKNIIMKNASNPIIIDQSYCDQDKPCKEQDSAVEIIDVTYQNISGTSADKEAITFECSKGHPCQGVVLQDINLTQESGGKTKAICNNVELTYIGTVTPKCPNNIVLDQPTFGTSSCY